MNLIMFDIDGTLITTPEIDETCFIKAVNEVMGIYEIERDLNHYKNITDEGIAAQIIEEHKGRPATLTELCNIQKKFYDLLKISAEKNKEDFSQVKGTRNILEKLYTHPDYVISLATGGWRESALLKLKESGLKLNKIPMASSSDAVSREEIMKISEELARDYYGVDKFENKIYIGDGFWDFRAAKSLKYSFIGIGKQNKAKILRDEGAEFVIPDFSDPENFCKILKTSLAT